MLEHPFIDPPDDPPAQECDSCGEWVEGVPDGDEDGPFLAFSCTNPFCEDGDTTVAVSV